MKIICERCGNKCADIWSKAAIEQYIKGEFSVTCEYCGEDNYNEKI